MTILTHNSFLYMFISILCMFRAYKCSSSGDSIVSIRYLVYVTPCRGPSGMQIWTIPSKPAYQTVTYISGIYQIYWYNWISWWWALQCSKHVWYAGLDGSVQTCLPDGHLHSVTCTRFRTYTIESPDDEHLNARNMSGTQVWTVPTKPAYQTVTYIEWHVPDIVFVQLNLLMMSTWMLETCLVCRFGRFRPNVHTRQSPT